MHCPHKKHLGFNGIFVFHLPSFNKDTHAFRSFCAGEMAPEEARSGRQAGACQRGAQSRAVFISAKAVSALAKRRYIHHRGRKNSFSRRFAQVCSSMARWEQNAASAKYLAPVGHPFTQAWHLMQMPLQTLLPSAESSHLL